jgi:uncharacterized protein (DUF58 family)
MQRALSEKFEAQRLAAAFPPILLEAIRVANTVAQGVHGRRRVGVGEAFWQFRRYQEGDTASDIDWRQSARSQHHFVRENEWEAAQSVWIWCDGSESMRYTSLAHQSEKIARARLLALALSSLLLRGGERVGVLGKLKAPTSGPSALTRIAIALLDNSTSSQNAPAPQPLPRNSQVVLLSDFLSPAKDVLDVVESFASNKGLGHLVQVIDPAEVDLPFSGRTKFLGLENEAPLIIGRAEDLRTDYQAAFRAHQETLTKGAARLGWTFGAHRSDKSPHTALLALYNRMLGETTTNWEPFS